MKSILYELNEVPWRVIDFYVQKKPKSAFAYLVSNSACFTTITRDEGELHPWTTWPSLHRGVYNTTHGITFINQELPAEPRPLWEILQSQGRSVGVFGSLQSYGSWPKKPEDYAFYVPDTFAKTPKTHPVHFEAFQRFNLTMTARDGAVAKAELPSIREIAGDVWGTLRAGLRIKTLALLAAQVAREKRDSNYRTRRAVFQAPIAFDMFLRAYRETAPEFATFFTNHAAGMMHRYWQHAFPEDFEHPPLKNDSVRARNVEFAMDVADSQLKELLKLASKHDITIIVASSMGQEAIDRGEYIGEFRIVNVTQFASALGFRHPFSANLAMQPDFAFEFEEAQARDQFRTLVESLVGPDGSPLFLFKERGLTLNLNLQKQSECLKSETIFRREESRLTPYACSDFGFEKLNRDIGTGYHQPRGSLMFHGPGIRSNSKRVEVELNRVNPTLLKLNQIPVPEGCAEPISI